MVNSEENIKEIRAYKRPYIVFGIMFGWMPIGIIFLSYSRDTIARDLPMIAVTLGVFLLVLAWLSIYKISYDDRTIKYRGLFGTKTIKIADIKKYQIKTETHSNPFKPMFGLFIDTVNKKSEIIIPINIFSPNDINDLLEHIDTISKSPKGRSRAGKSVFKYGAE